MEWRTLDEFPGYEVSEFGQIRNAANGRLRTPINDRGYNLFVFRIGGRRKSARAHTLVAKAFIGPKPFPRAEACHCNGQKSNNHFTNIRWDTHAANCADKVVHGVSTPGEKNPFSKLEESQVLEIRRLAASGVKARDMSERFGVATHTIHGVIAKRSWKHV